jgi:phosphatidylglycerophosphatase A
VRSLSSLLATFFGIGRIPFASGTFASAAALPIGVLLAMRGWPALGIAVLVAIVVGIWACGEHAAKLHVSDPSECVLDEVAGQWIALMPIAFYARPYDWPLYAIGFFLFRLFDIAKFWPMSAAEDLPGGLGVMADDVLAGLIAAALLWIALATGWV